MSFDVPSGFNISNSWNGNFSVNGTKVTVGNVEYNGDIPVGGSVNFGFNYSSPTTFAPPENVDFNGTKSSAPSNNNGNNSNSQNNNSDNNQNDQNNDQNNDKNPVDTAPSGTVAELLKRTDKSKQGDDWLHTDGNKILDKNGKQVWLTGVNWFGYNTGTNTFDGLWNSNLRSSVKGIADHGFNLIRVPISAELLNQWSRGEYPKANYNNASNPELNDMNSLQIFDYFLKLAEENGLKVMPDIHCAETNAMGHNVNLWYTDKVSVDDYYHALEWIADRYKDNDTMIALDIKNEPHGKPNEGSSAAIWNNSTAKNNWKYTAETAAKKVLAKNPNLLIMVEGTEIYSKKNGDYSSSNSADYYFNWWGGNLRGVKDYPVDLGQYQNKLVYSPHDYGPTVYEQPWFQGGYSYDSLIRDCWQDNWLYIHKDNTAPLLIGEWGGFMREPNLTWMTCMRKLIKEYHLNHTFWCYNANSGHGRTCSGRFHHMGHREVQFRQGGSMAGGRQVRRSRPRDTPRRKRHHSYRRKGVIMHLLFLCSRNKRRSLTAEKIFDGYNGHSARSAGTENDSRVKVTSGLLGWADIIFCMEKKHARRIKEKISRCRPRQKGYLS